MIAVNGWRIGRASLPLVAGLALFTLSDGAYAYTIAAGTYDVGGLIDVGWVLAFGAFAFGAWQTPRPSRVTVRVPHRRAAIAPAAFGALMVAILVALAGRRRSASSPSRSRRRPSRRWWRAWRRR